MKTDEIDRGCLAMWIYFLAIWLMPAFNTYGTWPASGEIDLVESRGNRHMVMDGVNIGTHEAGSTLHYGPYPGLNGFEYAHWHRRNYSGYDTSFHRFQLEWTPGKKIFNIFYIPLPYYLNRLFFFFILPFSRTKW
jgi:hypothetical protein